MHEPDSPGAPGFFIPDDDDEWSLVEGQETSVPRPSEDEVRATVAAVLRHPSFERNPVGTSFKVDDDLHAPLQQQRSAGPRTGSRFKLAAALLLLTSLGGAGFAALFYKRAAELEGRADYNEALTRTLRSELQRSKRLAEVSKETASKSLAEARTFEAALAATTAKRSKLAAQLKSLRYEDGKLSLDLEEAELRAVLQLVAKASGRNLILSAQVTGSVTAELDGVPLMDALRGLVRSVGPYVVIEGGSGLLRVMPLEECERQLESIALPLKHIRAPNQGDFELFRALKGLINATPVRDDTIEYDRQTNAFILRATAPMIAEVRAIIAALDRPPAGGGKAGR